MSPTTADAVAIYNPNGPAAIIAFIVFGGLAITLWTKYFRSGKPRPKYTLQTILGTTFMSLGFICRFSRRNHINAWSWLFETLFILLSPCAFLAQMYGLVPRLAKYINAENTLVMKGRVAVILFVIIDITLVIAQLAGTALTITFGKLVHRGVIITTAALWVQLVFFSIYFLMSGISYHRLARSNPHWRSDGNTNKLFYLILLSSILLLIRSIYRVAEYTSGADSKVAQSEPAFYILDTLPMLGLISLFVVVWPPSLLENPKPTTHTSDISII
ncbi:uncharacterized protein L201_003989 [Kwoniella dendrophila CBS 6074]|uniref:Uncharacterized protein n=1 Tax=Kwoniella dendrophila CBS 6074 TaxID=1295534 RepID=A0AAX4JUF6_9TREE